MSTQKTMRVNYDKTNKHNKIFLILVGKYTKSSLDIMFKVRIFSEM